MRLRAPVGAPHYSEGLKVAQIGTQRLSGALSGRHRARRVRPWRIFNPARARRALRAAA